MRGHLWRFSSCEFDDLKRELRVAGRLVDVEVKPLDVLLQLLLRPGEVVTKEELLDAVWPGTQVVEGSLPTAVSKLRRALRPHEDLVITIPRVGYRLSAPSVRCEAAPVPAWPNLTLTAGETVPARPLWRLNRLLAQSPFREVWLASNPKTSESRVFKFARDDHGLHSLKREVALARLLRQGGDASVENGFVRILEWNFDSAPFFVEIEYAGTDLLEWAAAQGGLERIPLETRLGIAAAAARAISAAHSLDVLHKDLKPSNIMVNGAAGGFQPEVRIGDLGSASLLAPGQSDSFAITDLALASEEGGANAQVLAGTILYAAPEVLAGQPPSRASDVYALGLLLFQLAAASFHRALAPGWEADVPSPELRELIGASAAGNPERRLSAAAFAERLACMQRPRAGPQSPRALSPVHGRTKPGVWLALAAACAALVAAGVFLLRTPTPGLPPRPAPIRALRTVAVVPLANVTESGANSARNPLTNALGMAIADEVAAILVRVRGLGVRPVTLPVAGADPLQVAAKWKADSVVTGRFQVEAGKLRVSLAAIDAATGRLLWQDTVQAPRDSLVALQVQLALRVNGGLARALGGEPPAGFTEPFNEEGYQLFLRSVALSSDSKENRSGIHMLERAVALDPGYAPAWAALSKRYYLEARYGKGGRSWIEQANSANQRVLALDPGSALAAASLVIDLVERGQLVQAFQRASEAAARRPDSVEAQFALSYALRFAGLLRDSARHCETAYLLDPRTSLSGMRSCAVVFLLLDDEPRTANYLRLDEGSDFEAGLALHSLLRHGRREEALRLAAARPPSSPSFRLLAACAAHPGAAAPDAIPASDDPESNYFAAAHLAYCGREGEALRLLRLSVEGGYCAVPAMERDPLLAGLRARREFTGLLESGRACQSRFLDGLRAAGLRL